ncbi:GDSL-type esterase/lipase family protein [Terribacillus sp. 179-K 1B1 HS]|uniref:SGNH/GDSL hydrolase family protein n=1 Tax=Terribacillus sp. 179-K 1B1 HS TaxID=3142388 RepID=UPI0039A0E120
MKYFAFVMSVLAMATLVIIGKVYYDNKIESSANESDYEAPNVQDLMPLDLSENSKEEETFDVNKYVEAENYIEDIPWGLDNYYFSGRWYPSSYNGEQGMLAIQQSQEIYFKVSGTENVTAKLMDTTGGKITPPRISYQIDGEKWETIFPKPGYTSIEIANDLDKSKDHIIRIFISSLYDGSFSDDAGVLFAGTNLDKGAEVTPVKPDGRVIYAMGDSITAGKANWTKEDKEDGFEGTTAGSRGEKGYISYTGYYLHSRVINNSFGGTGVVRELDTANALEAIDYLAEGLEDNYDYNPDLVVINHGTNDYANMEKEDITAKEFSKSYKDLVDKAKKKFPDKPIFLVIPFNQSFANEIREVAKDYKDDNIHVIPTKGWKISYSDAVHPDSEGVKAAGENIADAIVDELGEEFFFGENTKK